MRETGFAQEVRAASASSAAAGRKGPLSRGPEVLRSEALVGGRGAGAPPRKPGAGANNKGLLSELGKGGVERDWPPVDGYLEALELLVLTDEEPY